MGFERGIFHDIIFQPSSNLRADSIARAAEKYFEKRYISYDNMSIQNLAIYFKIENNDKKVRYNDGKL
jgi:hypothetical protein